MPGKESPSNRTPPLGELEIAVMEALWRAPGQSAKNLHATVGSARGISVNTVQSTLDRLYRKQLLSRTKVAHAFHYQPQVARQQLIAGLINDLLGRFTNDARSSLAAFVDAADQLDEGALDELEQVLKERRGEGTSS
ncbi:BlaI/MecI/CopY family transcriptional regulator [Marinimicrobium sp. C6131]|uniref:BlaI/MecI/CopY family transcriptional regulator n=1 Tax=Marinimicrobium sp. C6131 TaxID=3022676 RepID=UPI00223C8EDB|nr:BlaI/MecI/CopY family transcriptional regulator [Marinimicrobium sp. C6131]UZJ44677.1 BlaI/MecI/CopY family transcriptional regulator [Marinimicrobium sp. C6131]